MRRRAGFGPRAVIVVILGLVLVATAMALGASAGRSERPANDVTEYVADLREAATLVQGALGSAAWVGSRGAKRCDQFEPAANKVAGAADAARAVFERYRKARTRYGTQEELQLITTIGTGLREARGSLRKAAGETDPMTQSEMDDALREVGLFQTFVAIKIEDRLSVEGLADVLMSRSFRDMRDKVVKEIQAKLRTRAEAELKRLTGLGIRLGVPLKQQIEDFLRAEFSRMLSRLVVTAGPAGIFVSMLGERIFNLIGSALKAALRYKGNLDARTDATLASFEQLRRRLNALPPNATLDKVRGAVRATERALGATTFLKGDVARADRNDLALDLRDAEADLVQTLKRTKFRFLLDADLMGENFGIAVAAMRTIRADVERVAKKLGCTVAPAATGGGDGTSGKGKPPTAAVCVPKTIRMEYHSSLGGKLGEYDATFQELVRTYPDDRYGYKCLWYASAPKDEAFVVFISLIPPGIPGRPVAGNCDGTRKDSYPFYHSRKRYLSVSGGERKSFQNALGGNDKILKGVLAAAESAGVGQACPKK